MLTRLTYSSAVGELGAGGTQEILEKARKYNDINGVTGILLYTDRYFFQCLEGGRQHVTSTFCRIAADRRHSDVQLIAVSDAEERYFLDWSMAYVPQTAAVKAALRRVMPTEDFVPGLMSERTVDALTLRLRDLYRTE